MFIITGGGSGIGKALALALAKRGNSVLIVGRRKELLQETAAYSSLIHYVCADVSTDEGVDAVRLYVKHIPHIEALINNAGTLNPIVSLKKLSRADWQHSLNTNIDSSLFLTQKLYKQLVNGRVLNISSGAAHFAIEGWAAYCTSKAALSMLTQCWQLESQDIAFASVMPGIVDTNMQMIARASDGMSADVVDFYKNLKQDNKLISPETVAEFLVWLLLVADTKTYSSKEWDIYDTRHHSAWLKPPHQVLHWES